MKKLITILCLVLSLPSFSTNYYFSTAGSDANAGTSTGAAFQTLTKFNSFFSTLAAGDSVLFKRGDVFDGIMTISKSGSAGSPIKIGAYGTGVKPIINGFTTVSAWVNIATGIWESSAAVSALSTMNMVTLNGVPMAMGRYPKAAAANSGYLLYQSHTGGGSTNAASSITSNAISGITSFVGGELVLRPIEHILDRAIVTAQTSTTVSFNAGSYYGINNNYGFFFQNHPATLTQTNTTLGEWYYDPSTKKLRVYFGGNTPSSYTVKGSAAGDLVTAVGRSYITFDNMEFQGANNYAFKLDGSSNVTLSSCDVKYTGVDGVSGLQSLNTTITECIFNWTNDNAIYMHTNNRNTTTGPIVTGHSILNNTIRNSGTFAGMGTSGDARYCGITSYGSNNTVQGNSIVNTGWCPIYFVWGSNVLIKNNFIDSFGICKDDIGGVYSWNNIPSALTFTGWRITGNIILHAIHSRNGTSNSQGTNVWVHGIYFDNNVAGGEIDNNTVAYVDQGLFNYDAHNCNYHDNTLFGNNRAIDIDYALVNGSQPNTTLVSGLTVKNNIFFAQTSTQRAANYRSIADDILTWGTFDSNYYCRPIAETSPIHTITHQYGTGGAEVNTDRTLAGWKTYSGKETNSNITATTVTDASKIRFEYNETAVSKNVSLGASYVGVDGTSYSGTISIPAYSSQILLETAAVAVVCPTSGTTTSGTYYFSTACGDDNRTATQARNPATPWKTVAKLNSYFASLSPGDSALFNRGETFPGGITVGRSGTSGSPIIIGAHGTGADPILTQMTSVTSWVALGGNIYETPGAISTLSALDMVTVNGVPVGKGRYPNANATNGGYLTITGVTGTTGITVATLPTTTNYSGAEVVIRSTHYQLDRSLNISHNTATHVITYTNTSGTTPVNGFGCWIQNAASTLDQQGEWYYNTSTKKLRMYSVGTPSGVAVATGTNLVTSASRSDIKFDNITFSGCNGDNVSLSSGARITFQNCTVKNSGKAAFQVSGTKHAIIQSDSIINNLDLGVHLINSSHGAIVKDNYIRNTAIIPGAMQTDANHGEGIFLDASNDTVLVQGNSVINSGSAGINFRGSDSLWIKNNLVDSFCLVIDDIGGIYGYLGGLTPLAPGPLRTIRIRGNIVRNGIGATLGTPSSGAFANSAFGLYWDNTIGNIYCDSNHVVNGGRAAVYFHYLVHHVTMRANSLYNTQYLVYVSRSSTQDITNNVFKNNILWTTGTQKAYWFENFTSSATATFGTIDSNNIVYQNTNTTPFTIHSNATGSINYTIGGWKATGRDVRSDTLTTVSTSTVREDFAATSANVVALGGYSWLDAKKTLYSNKLTYNPFRGGILKRWQLVGLAPPVVNLTSPANGAVYTSPASFNINATATDADGIISDVKFYNGATLLNTDVSSPYSYAWTGVTAGTYTLTAKATDNDGLVTTSSPINITVGAVPPPVVGNKLPVINIISPANDSSFYAPATFTVTASASDSDGTITRVDFYKDGGVFIGTDATAPYTVVRSNIAAGGYSYTAWAVDNSGDSTRSSAINVTVVVPVYVPPDTLSINVVISNPILCSAGSATVNLSATGGQEPYSYTGGAIQTKTAGVYDFIVTDNLGVKDTLRMSVPEPGPLSATQTHGVISVYGGTTTDIVTALGGTTAYQYRINGGVYQTSNRFTIAAGTYTIGVKDANGCTYNLPQFSVSQPSPPADIIIHNKNRVYF